MRKALDIIKDVPGVGHTVARRRLLRRDLHRRLQRRRDLRAAAARSRSGSQAGQTADSIVAEIQKRLFAIQDGFIIVIKPPTVQGLGQGGGFKMQVQDRGGIGLAVLEQRTQALIAKANQTPGLVGVFTTFSTRSPQLFVDIDRTKARMLGVPISNIFQAMQVYVGSSYVNDFSYFGRAFQVIAQADAPFRVDPRTSRASRSGHLGRAGSARLARHPQATRRARPP